MECEYCKKKYSSPSSLLNHQKTTKSCLKIQIELGKLFEEKFKCEICYKIFSSKQRLEYHSTTHQKESIVEKLEQLEFENRNLKEEFKHELNLKEQKIKELEEQIKNNPAYKTTIHNKNTNTNINNNQFYSITINEVMTEERVEEVFKKHYNLDTLLGGQAALARFINDGIINNKGIYKCTDRSRQKFYRAEKDGWKEDPDCQRLLELTIPGLSHITNIYEDGLFSIPDNSSEEEIQENYKSIVHMDKDRNQFKNELSKIIPNDSINESNKLKNAFVKMQDVLEKEMKSNDTNESQEPLVPHMIGPFTYGKLDAYRKKFTEEGIIKAPKELVEQFETNPALKQEYINFVTGIYPVYP